MFVSVQNLLIEQRVSGIHNLNSHIALLNHSPQLSPDLKIFLEGGSTDAGEGILHTLCITVWSRMKERVRTSTRGDMK